MELNGIGAPLLVLYIQILPAPANLLALIRMRSLM